MDFETLFAGAPNPCRLLIIAPDDFAPELVPLITHKNRTGMPSHLIKLSAITRGLSNPADHPWAIKRVIGHGHKNKGTFYVMLAGDASHIPVRHRWVAQPTSDPNRWLDGTYNPADSYYAHLYKTDGVTLDNWDSSGNGKFNQVIWGISPKSHNPDQVTGFLHVSVGRIPAHDSKEVRNYVRKVIEYELGMRQRASNAFSFIGDALLPGSLEHSNSVISTGKLESKPLGSVTRFYGNVSVASQLPQGWSLFRSSAAELVALTAKFTIHMGHGSSDSWGIALGDGRSMNNAYVLSELPGRWNTSNSHSFPIILSGGCDTGFISPNAPFHRYRGLSPDVPHHFWQDDASRTVTDRAASPEVVQRYPMTVPMPHPYDLPEASNRSFASSWLCKNVTGGAIAYVGATVGHEGAAFGADLFLRILRQVGHMNVLGDIWAQGCRDYLADRLNEDSNNGSPRVYLSIMTLYGDPSLRLSAAESYGFAACVANDRPVVFGRSAAGTLTHTFYDRAQNKWVDPIDLGGFQSSAPAAAMIGDRLTVFGRTDNGMLTHRFYNPQGQAWSPWLHLGGEALSSAPTIAVEGNVPHVFARSEKGELLQRSYMGSAWTAWSRVGTGMFHSNPSATFWAGHGLVVVATNAQGALIFRRKANASTPWTDWITGPAGMIVGSPCATISDGRLVVFARTAQGTLTHTILTTPQASWLPWTSLGEGVITSDPEAMMIRDRLTVFARTAHKTLTHKYWDPTARAWTQWLHIGTALWS